MKSLKFIKTPQFTKALIYDNHYVKIKYILHFEFYFNETKMTTRLSFLCTIYSRQPQVSCSWAPHYGNKLLNWLPYLLRTTLIHVFIHMTTNMVLLEKKTSLFLYLYRICYFFRMVKNIMGYVMRGLCFLV